MLLWMLILTLFGAMVAVWGGNLPPSLRARVLAVQATIAVAFFGFILATSNPFLRLAVPPPDGNDLNPLLQDPGLAFHPPFLYLGYVGLSMAYSFAIAALIEGRVDAAWARWVRPWTLLAWVFLTIGIAFGSIWAYYELGWGGWWFWDPVENVSFMPWLISAALLHSAIVVEKRDTLKSWTILLAILAFSFSPRRRLHRPLGHPHQRARLRRRPRARHLSALDPRRLHRRLAAPLRLAGAGAALGRRLRRGQPRERARRQQPPPRHRHPRRLLRHHVAAPRRGPDRAQGLGRPALLQPRLHPLHDGARGRPAALRPPALEARQPRAAPCASCARRSRSPSRSRRWSGRCRPAARCSRPSAPRSPPGWCSAPAPTSPAASGSGRPAPARRCAARATCRAPTGARRWRTPASASRSGASPRSPPGRSRTSARCEPGDSFAVAGYELRFDGASDARGPNYTIQRATVTVLARRPRDRHAAPGEAALRRAGAWPPPRPASTAA